MDLLDVSLNLFRKSLGPTVYNRLRHSPLGRPYRYCSIGTYGSIFGLYRSAGTNFRSKKILEVGCGEQFYTAYHFLAAGARSVTLVDPVFTRDSSTVRASQLRECEEKNGGASISSDADVRFHKSLDEILPEETGTYDFICSHFALEHFDDLGLYFRGVRRLLAPHGTSCNFVDLSDHVYHLFDSRPSSRWLYRTRMLNHLRYSDPFYNAITDRRIWVNRLLLPSYESLAAKHGLRILSLDPSRYHRVRIHGDVLERNHTLEGEDLYVTHFSMLLGLKGA
jgi:SAM-dependent methyltransferase